MVMDELFLEVLVERIWAFCSSASCLRWFWGVFMVDYENEEEEVRVNEGD